MKTKEEILEELFYKPETQDWYKPVLKAMETYAQQLRQPLVSGGSEQLKGDEHKSAEWRSKNLGYGSKGEMVYIK